MGTARVRNPWTGGAEPHGLLRFLIGGGGRWPPLPPARRSYRRHTAMPGLASKSRAEAAPSQSGAVATSLCVAVRMYQSIPSRWAPTAHGPRLIRTGSATWLRLQAHAALAAPPDAATCATRRACRSFTFGTAADRACQDRRKPGLAHPEGGACAKPQCNKKAHSRGPRKVLSLSLQASALPLSKR